MPGRFPKLAAIIEQGLEDGFRRGEIDQRKQVELDSDQLPDSQEKRGGGEKTGAMTQPGAEPGNQREQDGGGEDGKEDGWVGVGSGIQAAVGKKKVDSESDERSTGNEKRPDE
jgi:hypothetical protein